MTVVTSGSGSMVSHTEPFFVIDSTGTVRSTWDAVTGSGSSSVLGRSGTSLIVARGESLAMRRLGALVAVGLALAGCSATSSSSSPESQTRALPVAGGVLDGSTAMAVLPLGHLEDPSNTFYETFSQNGSGSWSLSTPEGTATNGGIVLASPARGAGAVLSYLNLRLAAGFDLVAGQQTGAGEVLPLLAHVPSSLSVDPHTGAVAVLTEQGEVLTASSLAGPFHQLLSERRWRPRARTRPAGCSGSPP